MEVISKERYHKGREVSRLTTRQPQVTMPDISLLRKVRFATFSLHSLDH